MLISIKIKFLYRYQPRWCDDSKKLRPWKEHANLKSLNENDDNCTPWELEEQSDEELNKVFIFTNSTSVI